MALMVFMFYGLNMDTILGMKRFNPYVYQIFLFFGVILAVNVWQSVRSGAPSILRMITHPVMAWGILYVSISVLSLAVTYHLDYALHGILYAGSTAAIVGAAAVAFTQPVRPSSWQAGRVAVWMLVVACVSLLLDPIMDFRARLPTDLPSAYDRTRAGGIFFQPNIAASAVPFLLATVIARVRPRLGLVCGVLSVAAVALTFSRSGLLLLTLVITMGYLRGYLPRGWSLVAMLVCALTLAWFQGSTVAEEVFHIDEGSGLARLTRTYDFVSREALSSDARLDIVMAAWNDVGRAPLVGGGVGYSWYWADSQASLQGPHNMYLRHMLEYGLLGALLWPLFLLALYKARNRVLDRAWVIGVLATAFIAGMFSHNLTEQGVFLVPLMGAISLPAPTRFMRGASDRGPEPS